MCLYQFKEVGRLLSVIYIPDIMHLGTVGLAPPLGHGARAPGPTRCPLTRKNT